MRCDVVNPLIVIVGNRALSELNRNDLRKCVYINMSVFVGMLGSGLWSVFVCLFLFVNTYSAHTHT